MATPVPAAVLLSLAFRDESASLPSAPSLPSPSLPLPFSQVLSLAFPVPSNTPLRLGTGENGPLNGQMREVQIHARALSESDLARLSVVRPRD